MSAQTFEIVLARLFTDQDFLDLFLIDSERAMLSYDLTESERADLKDIDTVGLIMASRSFLKKREKRMKHAL